jgi:hypothetical protein
MGKFRRALASYSRNQAALRARQTLLEGDLRLYYPDNLVRQIECSLHAYYASIAAIVLSDRQVVAPYAEIAYESAIRSMKYLDEVAHLNPQPTPEERRAWRYDSRNVWNNPTTAVLPGPGVYALTDIALSLMYPLTERFHNKHDRFVVDKRLQSISDYVNGAVFLQATVGDS